VAVGLLVGYFGEFVEDDGPGRARLPQLRQRNGLEFHLVRTLLAAREFVAFNKGNFMGESVGGMMDTIDPAGWNELTGFMTHFGARPKKRETRVSSSELPHAVLMRNSTICLSAQRPS